MNFPDDGTLPSKKTAETIEAIGKILQGQASLLTPEQLDTALNAIKDPNSEEYAFITTLIVSAITAAVSGAVSAGVSHAFKKG